MTYTSRATITAPTLDALRDQIAASIAEKAAQGERVTEQTITATLTFGAQK